MLAALQAIGTVVSVYSTIQQGRAVQEEAQREASLYQAERKTNELQTLQRNNDRMSAYNAALATNTAWFAFAGRDASDRSVQAFLNRQKEIAYTDLSRSSTQGFMEDEKLRYQRDLTLVRGQTAKQQSYISAASTITSGLFKYEQIKGT